MTVSFNIEYRTSWGEEVRIAGLLPESIPMHTTDGIYWTADVELEVPKEGMTINYSYQIEQNQIIIRKRRSHDLRLMRGNLRKSESIGYLGPGQSDSHERCQLSGMADRAGCK